MTPKTNRIWFAYTAVVAMTMMNIATMYIVSDSAPHVVAFGGRNRENKDFNSFPIDSSEWEFNDRLS
jgi:hypothetical protein